MFDLTELTAISPVDGRYRTAAQPLLESVTEYGLIRYRVRVECEYLIALASEPSVPLKLSRADVKRLRAIANVKLADAELVKRIELEGLDSVPATRHDVKAVEYFLRCAVRDTSLEKHQQWIHFGLTSEDVNSIAYALMVRDATYVLLKSLKQLISSLESLATTHADLPMLARTHGQSASPTTFGKEIRVFVERLQRQYHQARTATLLSKVSGATGNYNAHMVALPKTNWSEFSHNFIASLNSARDTIILESNPHTTQIEPHDSMVELFQTLMRINAICVDLSQDMWRYISDGWLKQRAVAGEVGSSAMPHKVNPIDFENGEGNAGVANALFGFFAANLPVSRLQRDLSDSTVQRNIGSAYAHSLIAYEALQRGLTKVSPDARTMSAALSDHPEVVAEAIQTVLRKEGVAEAYEALKELTRGKTVTLRALRGVVAKTELPPALKKRLQTLTPQSYTGKAAQLARRKGSRKK